MLALSRLAGRRSLRTFVISAAVFLPLTLGACTLRSPGTAPSSPPGEMPAPTKDELARVDQYAFTLAGYTSLRQQLPHLDREAVLWIGIHCLALQARSGLSISAPDWIPLARYALGDLPLDKLPPRFQSLVENPKNPGDLPFVIAARAEPVVWHATLQHWVSTLSILRNTQLLAQLP